MPLSKSTLNQGIHPVTARLNAEGRWEIGGSDLAELVKTYGSPLYVLDEATIQASCRAYLQALREHYPGPSEVLYASKALCNLAVNRLIHEEGLSTEVVSGGELFTVLKAGIPAESVTFQGNNKSPEELRYALKEGVGRIIVDNLDELDLLSALAEEIGVSPNVLLRVTPGIEAHTHEFIRTGEIDSKFGLDLPEQLDEAMRRLIRRPLLRFRGLHAHVGSQIFDVAPFVATVEALLNLSAQLERDYGLKIEELDVGGGLGIAYEAGDDPPSIPAVIEAVALAMVRGCSERGLSLPKLIVEPGRSIVGTAGATLYTVGARKEIPGVRTYVAIDGGMPDNPRVVTYGARYSADRVVAGDASELVTLAGKCCESGDLLIKDIRLPKLTAGDHLVVWGTGAYCFAMASNYNRLPRPAMVLVAGGHPELIRERETFADVVSRDRLPNRLGGQR
jgi:diaminopimelate decarboxylase